MKVSYFPGCTLKNKAKDLDVYARRCAEVLGITLEEIENANDNSIALIACRVEGVRLIDNIYFINPGSISLPRDAHGLSYAILEISKDDVKVIFLNV